MWVAIPIDERRLSLVLVPGNTGDVHVYRHGRWSVAISAAGGLEALQFVQCSVQAALYAGLVTGELREEVRAVAVPYERQTERIRVQIPHISVGLLHEYACLHPAQSPKPPVGGDDPIDEEVLQLSDRLKLGPQVFVQLPQRLLVLSRQENLLRAQAVLEGVQADGVLPLWRLGAGALQGVPAVGFGFLLTSHYIDLLRSVRVDHVKGIVGQSDYTSSTDSRSPIPTVRRFIMAYPHAILDQDAKDHEVSRNSF